MQDNIVKSKFPKKIISSPAKETLGPPNIAHNFHSLCEHLYNITSVFNQLRTISSVLNNCLYRKMGSQRQIEYVKRRKNFRCYLSYNS